MFPGLDELNSLSTTMAVLSAMITPVVLMSACASLAISTANRLGRTIDRTRKLLDRFEQLTAQAKQQAAEPAINTMNDSPVEESLQDDEGILLFDQLSLAARRSKLLHRALASLYIALSIFVATSVALGFIVLADERYAWMPLVLGMFGAGLLFYTSVLLVVETRVARKAINGEMDYALRRTRLHASPKMLEHQQHQRRHILDILQ